MRNVAETERVDRYLAVRNETDAARRRALIAATWTEDAHYIDPVMQGDGHDGIEALVQGYISASPATAFARWVKSTGTTATCASHGNSARWVSLCRSPGATSRACPKTGASRG